MNRKLLNIVLFAPLLACLMGASSIAFDQGQPVPNPGGAQNTLEGKGTYAVDPAETFNSVQFQARETKTKQLSGVMAAAAQNKWDAKLLLVAGNYDSNGLLVTKDKDGAFVFTKSKVVNVNVK